MPKRLPLALIAMAALAACTPKPEAPAVPSGAEDFATYCATCHGPGGKGDGVRNSYLRPKAPDLTAIAMAADGSFPQARVMTQIWGYARATPTPGMPGFAALLEGPTVLYDSGDGIMTPTPLRLVQLMEFVGGL